MATDKPTFTVTRVEDGSAFGLLIEKCWHSSPWQKSFSPPLEGPKTRFSGPSPQPDRGARPQRAYFYFPAGLDNPPPHSEDVAAGEGPVDMNGCPADRELLEAQRPELPPSPSIRRNCEVYALDPTRKLGRFVGFLARYTTFAHNHAIHVRYESNKTRGGGDKPPPMPLTHEEAIRYLNAKKEVFRYKTQPFPSFIGSTEVFASRVLKKPMASEGPEGRDYLIGRAAGFRVCTLEALIFEEDFEYLETARQALADGRIRDSEWFRVPAPVAVDFRDHLVLWPPVYQGLYEKLRSSPVSVLVGLPSSGKTVLVRGLMYTLREEQQVPVYYVRYCRSMSVGRLAEEIRSVDGLVILEDAHRDPSFFLDLCERTIAWKGRYLLLTARPAFLDYLGHMPPHQFQVIWMEQTDSILESRSCLEHRAKHIISYYSANAFRLTPDQKKLVARVAGGDLFLVGQALRAISDGADTEEDLVGYLARKRLLHLETDEHINPDALVAVSALGQDDTPVAESFLTDYCRASQADLAGLARLSEVIREDEGGEFHYRMPHPALAAAYWIHGLPHGRSLPSYGQLLHAYVASRRGNSLEALANGNPETARPILRHIIAEDQLSEFAQSERTLTALARLHRLMETDAQRATIEEIIVARLQDSTQFQDTVDCLNTLKQENEDIPRRILNACDPSRLTPLLSGSPDLLGAAEMLHAISRCGTHELRDAIVSRIDYRELAAMVELHYPSANAALSLFHRWMSATPEAIQLWRALDHERIGSTLDQELPLSILAPTLSLLEEASEEAAHDVCSHLNLDRVGTTLSKSDDLHMVAYAFMAIATSTGRTQIGSFRIADLAALFSRFKDLEVVNIFLEKLHREAPDLAKEVILHLRFPALSRTMEQNGACLQNLVLLYNVSAIEKTAARTLWERTAHIWKGHDLTGFVRPTDGLGSVQWLYTVDDWLGRHFLEAINLSSIIDPNTGHVVFVLLCRILHWLKQVDPDRWPLLWKRVACPTFVKQVITKARIRDLTMGLLLLRKVEGAAREFCQYISPEELATRLHAEGLNRARWCVRSVIAASPEVGNRLVCILGVPDIQGDGER